MKLSMYKLNLKLQKKKNDKKKIITRKTISLGIASCCHWKENEIKKYWPAREIAQLSEIASNQ